jgi:hypothetical protein
MLLNTRGNRERVYDYIDTKLSPVSENHIGAGIYIGGYILSKRALLTFQGNS